LRFVAEGRAEPQGGTDWLVTVERVGVYVQDKFDFNGFPEAKPWSFHATGSAGRLAPGPTPSPPSSAPPAPAPPAPASPSALEVVVRRGDTLSGLAQEHYGDWRLWPLIWDQNRTAVGPRPSVLKIGTRLRLAPLGSFSSAVLDDARKRAPKWKNSEFR
jgi:LysM repeat protein